MDTGAMDNKSRIVLENALLEKKHSDDAIAKGKNLLAKNHLFRVLDILLIANEQEEEFDSLYVSITLQLANLCFVLGHSFREIRPYLLSAEKISVRTGDPRSKALIKLHLGRLYYFANERAEALKSFTEGQKIVEQLGDEDIRMRSGEFLGFFFLIQGLLKEAKMYFEYATPYYEVQSQLINVSAAIWMSYCDAYMGMFPRAIGRLAYHKNLAKEQSDKSLACTMGAVMGVVLIMSGRDREAEIELDIAFKEAATEGNAFAYHIAGNTLAYKYLLDGNPQKARNMCARTVKRLSEAGIVQLYTSPFYLEMFYGFHRHGLDPVEGFGFFSEVRRLLNDPNIHLRGVALRLRAMEAIEQNGDIAAAKEDLFESENCLIRSGNPIQLGKTRIELARLKLIEGDEKQASVFAQTAWNDLATYGEQFYPEDLKYLLKPGSLARGHSPESIDIQSSSFVKTIEGLSPTTNSSRLFEEIVTAITEFVKAERGAMFWFDSEDEDTKPILRAACNLPGGEVISENSGISLQLITESFRNNKPIISRLTDSPYQEHNCIFCIPFQVDGETRGVFYNDTYYLSDCSPSLDLALLEKMANFLNGYIAKIWKIGDKTKKEGLSIEDNFIDNQNLFGQKIVCQNATMRKRLLQADILADADCTILITGESGVGKELIAERLHRQSSRREQQFVAVNLSSIPESLLESELFGYEKGAFTGAEGEKKGRIEMAHRGTLFLDEIGEIPKFIQVKLLRVLQDHMITRVGGTKAFTSDFRLIAATNRNLLQEVSSGRFREDLYYRINVIPLEIPPLRERPEDIPLLADYFIKQFSTKYGRRHFALTNHDTLVLTNYLWPGNVRQLRNIIERAVLLSDGEKLRIELPEDRKAVSHDIVHDEPTMDELQRRYIRMILDRTEGRLSGEKGAATILGMKRSTLYNRMKKLGLA
jgi:transcriptional regulator with GAF, ATPase, and Fis domain/tetratricopeptide (TPR) repeat protein